MPNKIKLSKILLWILILPVPILVWVFRPLLALVAVTFFSSKDKRQLTAPFLWLMTIDNDLGGDAGWKAEHIAKGSDPLSWWNRFCWMLRNGGNSLNYNQLGIPYSGGVSNPSPAIWINSEGYWMLRKRFSLGKSDLELFWGWSLLGPQKGRCKLTATTRITKKLKS